MTERRFFVTELSAGSIELDDATARHVRVLRLRPGDAVTLFDGKGIEAEGEIARVDQVRVTVRVGALRRPSHAEGRRIVLVQAAPKASVLADVVRGVVEAGVDEIRLAMSARSFSSGSARLERIAREAARQAERSLPALHEIAELEDVARLAPPEASRLVLDARDGVPMPPLAAEAWLAVGPEGGFDAGEIALLEGLGYVRVRLDLPVMRVPTAATVAVALARLAPMA